MTFSRIAAWLGIAAILNFAWILITLFTDLPSPPDRYIEISAFSSMAVMALLVVAAWKYGNRVRKNEMFQDSRVAVYGKLHKVAASLLAQAETAPDAKQREALLTIVIALWDANDRTDWPPVGWYWPCEAHKLSPQLVRDIATLAQIRPNGDYVPWRNVIAERVNALLWAESDKSAPPQG